MEVNGRQDLPHEEDPQGSTAGLLRPTANL